jgi:hypothetical protein
MTRRLHIRLTLLVAFGVLQATSSAGAQSIYSCRDRNGHTLTSDRPITDCAGVMRELAPSGVVKREIAPPLTAEQQRQKEADDRVRRTAEEAAREQHRRDMALLTAYQNEDQIEAARKRSLSDASESIKASHERLAELEKEKNALAQDAEAYKGKTVPPLFKRKMDDNQALIDDEQAAIKQRQVDVERVNQRYDEEKRRFRELSAAKK